jgi:hypothetical protein
MATLDQAKFLAMLAESGMQVPEEQLSSPFEGYQHMLRLIEIIGRPSDAGR